MSLFQTKQLCLTGLCLLLVAGLTSARADSLSSGDRMKFADGLFSRGMYDLAIQEYETLLAADPGFKNSDAVYYRLGDAYRQLGKTTEAQKHYARVFKMYPKSGYAARAGVKRADIFIKDKRLEEGVELYRMVLKAKPPKDIGAASSYFMGEALLLLKRTNDAEKAFSLVVTDYAESEYYPFALLQLADLGVKRGARPEAVIKYYRAASTNGISQRAAAEALYQIGRLEFSRKRYEASSDAFDRLAQRYPHDVRTRESKLDAAWAQYNAGLTAKALQLADSALKNSKPGDKLRRDWLYLKANSERALKKHRDAVRTYTQLLEAGGDNVPAYTYERSLSCFALEEYKQVVDDLSRLAVTEKGIRQDVLWLQARASQELERTDQAVQYLSKLVKEFPDGRFSEEAMYRLADILRGRNDHKQAAYWYGKLADAFPKGHLAAQSLLAQGICRLETGEPDKALAAWGALRKSYSADKLVPEAILNSVAAEMSLKRFDEAKKSVAEFMKRYPKHAKLNEAHYWAGLLATQEGDHKQAEKAFSKAIGLNLEGDLNSKARAFRVLSIYRGGDKRRAADELQRLAAGKELSLAGRNIFVWLAEYRLEGKETKDAVDAAEKLLELSKLPLEKQEAQVLLGRAHNLAGNAKAAAKAFNSAFSIDEATLYRAEAALALGAISIDKSDTESAAKFFGTAAKLADEDDGIGIRARAYMGLGTAAEGNEEFEEAARYFMSVAVLFDDNDIVPDALRSAAHCYEEAGMSRERDRVLKELSTRYPEARNDE